MKCGDKGHVTALGQPCNQNIPKGASACLWHSRTAEQRSLLAARGSVAANHRRALSKDYRLRPFDNREAVIQFAQDMAELALKAPVDLRRIDSALRAAGLALQGFAQGINEKLVEALMQVEHGGVAFALYRNLTAPTAQTLRRPLPPRVVTAPAPEDGPA